MDPIFGAPDAPFGPRADLPAPFGSFEAIPDFRDETVKVGQSQQGGIWEAGEIWLPSAMTTVTRLGLRPKPALVGIAGAASVFKIEQDLYRSTAVENTDGSTDGVVGASIDRRAGYTMWQASPLSTLWQTNVRGQAAFGDDVPSTGQVATLSVSSGEPGSAVGSGTDGYIQFILASSVDAGVAELLYRRYGAFNIGAEKLLNGYCGASVYRSANLTVTNNTVTTVTFDSEDEDSNSFHSTSSNTERLTIPSGLGGVYRVRALASWNAGQTGLRETTIFINGTATRIAYGQLGAGQSGTGLTCEAERTIRLVATDFVIMRVRHTQGVNHDLLGGADLSKFELELVGV